jgi:hypothetical protein
MSPIATLAQALDLPEDGQDWGVEHADPSRLLEFIGYAMAFVPTDPWQSEELADLIFQSTEEAHDADMLTKDSERALLEYVRMKHIQFPERLRYWRDLPVSEWHVPRLLLQTDKARPGN